MKKLLLILTLAVFPALANADCYSIRDNDMKNNCLAMEKHETSYCYSIRDNDKKNYCLAKLKHERSYCYSIKDNNTKNECLTFVK